MKVMALWLMCLKTKRVYTSEDKVKVGIISSPKLDIFHMGMENGIISIE